tara:strand:+ start:368 stop:628 length:261 start_codon:yes stop_codon:yes gene_type:complete
MKAKEIILLWIENKYRSTNKYFFSFDFENEIANYGRLAHQKVHTPSTYSRAFRAIRSSNDLTKRGLELEEIEHTNKKSKGWRIKKI